VRGDSVWLFGLDGCLSAAESASAIGSAIPASPGPTRAAADLASGGRLFAARCAPCHGSDGRGGAGGGPSLEQSADFESVARVVTDGSNHMPAFGASLRPEEILDVSAYVTERIFPEGQP
jgi:mono/diheme cytochrome c family protein